MGRSIDTIQQEMIDDLVARGAAAGETITPSEWSAFDYRQLLTHAAAVACASTEDQCDSFVEDVEAIVAAASPQTPAWYQAQMKLFQFDATVPQVLQFSTDTFAPYYPVVDATKQVISKYVSVVPGIFGKTLIKVAAQVAGFPGDLDTAFPGALAAAQSAALLLSVPGIDVVVSSGNSDKIRIAADVYYQGEYSAVILANAVTAIQAYLAGIPFDGQVLLSNIELAIRAVPGVNDVVFNEVQARADGTAFGSGTNLVTGSTVLQRKWQTVAGYIQGETTTGNTLTDTINPIAE